MDNVPQRGTGAALVAHWDWAAERGLMKKNTARSMKAAAKQVIAIEPEWERLQVADMDVEDLLARFRNITHIRPESIRAYESRFRQAVTSYMTYLNSPTTYRAPQRPGKQGSSSATGEKRAGRNQAMRAAAEPPGGAGQKGSQHQDEGQPRANLVTYPFPIRTGVLAELRLPVDLSVDEADRVATFVKALAMTRPNGGAESDGENPAR
jgi:hypothetical protein